MIIFFLEQLIMKVRFTLFLLAIIVVASPAETFQDDNILAEEDEGRSASRSETRLERVC